MARFGVPTAAFFGMPRSGITWSVPLSLRSQILGASPLMNGDRISLQRHRGPTCAG